MKNGSCRNLGLKIFARYFIILGLFIFLLYSPSVLSGTLDDFESSESGSSSARNTGGCSDTAGYMYDAIYDYNYNKGPKNYPKSTKSGKRSSTMDKVIHRYLGSKEIKTTVYSTDNPLGKTVYIPLASECYGESLAFPKMSCLKSLRKGGYNAIPTIRFYGGYQKLLTDVQGYNFNLSGGYGMFGLEIDYIHYFESNPNDKLAFITPRALLRLPLNYFEFDLGIGASIMRGNRYNTGVNAGVAAYAFPIKNLIVDTKLYYTGFSEKKSMVDLNAGIAYKYKMFGVRGGYRSLWTNGNKTLHGPQIGLFVQW